MLLSMQDIKNKEGVLIQAGLTPKDLKGIQTETKRDGKLIVEQIEEYLQIKSIHKEKIDLMLASFREISKDNQRDEVTESHKDVAKLINGNASINKQIFTFIFEYVFKQIDNMSGHLDIVGEMYSEFLKYALDDGKEIGIVLTLPYVTKLMSHLLDINKDSRVMDLATGSAGFLISSMEHMIENFIDNSGADWNFNQHIKIDLTPTFNDIKRTISSYLDYKVQSVLMNQSLEDISLEARNLEKLKEDFIANNGNWETFYLYELFDKKTIKGVPKYDENLTEDPSGDHIYGQNIKYQYPQKIKLNNKYL